MTRQEQIAAAADQMFINGRPNKVSHPGEYESWESFIEGAVWADANPAVGFYRIETDETLKENSAIEKLAIAVEALKAIPISDDDTKSERIRSEALAAMEKAGE